MTPLLTKMHLLKTAVFLWMDPKNVFVGKSPTSVTTPALPLLLPYGTQNRDFFNKEKDVGFLRPNLPASWKVIINYLLGVSLVQLLQWIQWERQGVPLLKQHSPSLMVIILQTVNHPWWSLPCLSTATTRWLSAMRLTATAPGSTVIENNTVGSRSLWPSSSCHHHQSHQRHSRLWFINDVKISTMSSCDISSKLI